MSSRQPTPRFATVIWDVDSTLSGLEGIEWLATRRGAEVSEAVATMTARAMEGTIPLDAVYGQRLALVRPTRSDIADLARAYIAATLPGAHDVLATLRAAGVRQTLVSGGLREAVVPFAASLGVSPEDVHAVSVAFAEDGTYMGFDTASPLARRGGKPTVVRSLGLPRLLLAVGDGSTDAELQGPPPAVDAFAAFVGVAARPSALAVADFVARQLSDVIGLVLDSSSSAL
jgi:phosphoserine phosphatase